MENIKDFRETTVDAEEIKEIVNETEENQEEKEELEKESWFKKAGKKVVEIATSEQAKAVGKAIVVAGVGVAGFVLGSVLSGKDDTVDVMATELDDNDFEQEEIATVEEEECNIVNF